MFNALKGEGNLKTVLCVDTGLLSSFTRSFNVK